MVGNHFGLTETLWLKPGAAVMNYTEREAKVRSTSPSRFSVLTLAGPRSYKQ